VIYRAQNIPIKVSKYKIETDRKEKEMTDVIQERLINAELFIVLKVKQLRQSRLYKALLDDRGDVPGWVLVVLMTTGLVTALWTIAAPRLTAILKNSLDAMNGIR
jgi:hypothetical protein